MAFWLNLFRLVRRRNVALVATTLSIAMATATYFVLPAVHVSTATVVLTTSPTNEDAVAGDPNANPTINPLLNFNDGLNTALSILVQAMNTSEVTTELNADDGGTTVQITDIGGAEFLGNKGPFMFITAQSTASDVAARDMVVRAEKLAERQLLSRQRALKAPESQLISLLFVVPPTTPVVDSGGRYQGAGFAFLFGLFAAIGGAYVLEFVGRPQLRRGRARSPLELAGQAVPVASPQPLAVAVGDRATSALDESGPHLAAGESPPVTTKGSPPVEAAARASHNGAPDVNVNSTHRGASVEAEHPEAPRDSCSDTSPSRAASGGPARPPARRRPSLVKRRAGTIETPAVGNRDRQGDLYAERSDVLPDKSDESTAGDSSSRSEELEGRKSGETLPGADG